MRKKVERFTSTLILMYSDLIAFWLNWWMPKGELYLLLIGLSRQVTRMKVVVS